MSISKEVVTMHDIGHRSTFIWPTGDMFRTVLPPRHYPYDVFLKSGSAPTNKIQTMQRQSYGSRDQEFLKLKIYAIHKATYALVG